MAIDNDAYEWNEKGMALSSTRRYKEAIECYDKAIEIDPDDEWAWHNKGLALSDLGIYDEAIQCYNKAIDIDKDFVDAWTDKGGALFTLARYDEANECYDKAINIDPNDVVARINKGNTLLARAQYDEALVCYDKAIELDKELEWASTSIVWAWNNKGNVLNKVGRHEEATQCHKKAVEDSKKAMELSPNFPPLYVVKAKSLLAIDNISEAKKCLEMALDLDPNNIDALSILALVFSDYLHDHDKGIEIERQLLTIIPDDYAIKASIAEDLVAVGHYEEARTYALQVMNETQNAVSQCVARFLVLASYLLEDKKSNSDVELANFLNYYRTLDRNFKIEEDRWVFKGLIKAIDKSKADLQTKSLLLLLINLLQGKIDRDRLSFFHAV